jgi:hypothetical protein
MLKIVARSWADYQHFHFHELTSVSTVSSIKSKLVIRIVKKHAGLPIDLMASYI